MEKATFYFSPGRTKENERERDMEMEGVKEEKLQKGREVGFERKRQTETEKD